MLSDNEQRRLERIERELSREDPALAHVLAARGEDVGVTAQPLWIGMVGLLLFLGGLLGLGSVATLVGLAVVLVAALLPMVHEHPDTQAARRRRRR